MNRIRDLPLLRIAIAVVRLDDDVRNRLELQPEGVRSDPLAAVAFEARGHVVLRVVPLEPVEGLQGTRAVGEEGRAGDRAVGQNEVIGH